MAQHGYPQAVKTEHAGAKNGGGFHGPRSEAKRKSRKARRRQVDMAPSAIRARLDRAAAETKHPTTEQLADFAATTEQEWCGPLDGRVLGEDDDV